jgi:selenocysteine lyase/cysteine desulfurase
MNTELYRQDTAGLTGKIFMNSAGSSLMPRPVIAGMRAYLHLEEEHGGYKAEALGADKLSAFYTEAAWLLNCQEKNIAFACSATDAYMKALSSIPFRAGDHILTSNDDYVSNQIAFLSLQKRFGIEITRAGNLANGDLDLEHFERMLVKHRPRLVSLTHIPTNSGLIQDAAAVGRLCRQYDTWYLLDACQSVGQMPVDVQAIGCDFLSATGRKFMRAPRGTGLLYVSDRALEAGLEPLLPDMRGAEWSGTDTYQAAANARRFEYLEASFASLAGMAEALKYANTIGLDRIYSYNQTLSARLRENLSGIPGIRVLDKGTHLSNIITFHCEGQKPEDIEHTLNRHQVIYSVSRKRVAFIDFGKKGIDWAIRFSPHYFNTMQEI